MMHNLYYAGKDLTSDFSTFVDSVDSWVKPERDVTEFEIPGRNGSLIQDGKRFKNVTVPYRCFIMRDWKRNYLNLMAFLGSKPGYNRLEFSGDPDVYRMARIMTNVLPSPTAFLRHGNFTLPFDCKPQRFLKSGENVVTFTATGIIDNPTLYDAQPLITVTGSGTVAIGDTICTIAATESAVTIDSEIMECFHGTVSKNDKVSFSTNDFPVLTPGSSEIALGSGITKVEITPRWWNI